MSVLPFAPGVLPGTAPGAPSTGGLGSGAVGADSGTGGSADGTAFPDPGAEFAAALTAALGGVAPIPATAAATTAPITPPSADTASASTAAITNGTGASAPDEPAGLARRTGTVGPANRQGWRIEPSATGAGTLAEGARAAAVPPTAGGTAQPAAVAGLIDDAPLGDQLTAPQRPSDTPGKSATPGKPAVAPDLGLGGPASPTVLADGTGSSDQGRPFDTPTLPVRHANPDGSSGTVTPGSVGGSGAVAQVAGASVSTATGGAQSQDPVVQQVLPAVMQLATKGNGTHRISVTLQPEHLGEVRVTLVVRDGEVRVSLAADHRSVAQDALLRGAPELRRLLEATGATDSRVVVRDLPSATTTIPSAPTDRGLADRGLGDRAAGHPDGRPHGNADGRDGGGRHTGEQRREGRGAVPPPTIQRAAATTTATPTTGRLDRTV